VGKGWEVKGAPAVASAVRRTSKYSDEHLSRYGSFANSDTRPCNPISRVLGPECDSRRSPKPNWTINGHLGHLTAPKSICMRCRLYGHGNAPFGRIAGDDRCIQLMIKRLDRFLYPSLSMHSCACSGQSPPSEPAPASGEYDCAFLPQSGQAAAQANPDSVFSLVLLPVARRLDTA
jgi:hypothetical protein